MIRDNGLPPEWERFRREQENAEVSLLMAQDLDAWMDAHPCACEGPTCECQA